MEGRLNLLFERYSPELCRLIPGLYPATTVNLGPSVITVEHFDGANYAPAWIAITSLGEFDHKKGGHLILRSLGVLVEFPSGCTVLFPSSVVQHGNVPIQEGESRMSITQYASGSLFRWVDYGFRDEKGFWAAEREEAQRVWRRRPFAYVESLKLYSKLDRLYDDLMETYYPELAHS